MINVEFLRNVDFKILNNFKSRGFDYDSVYFNDIDYQIRRLKTDIYKLKYRHRLMSLLVKNLKHKKMSFEFLFNEIFLLKNFISQNCLCLNELEAKFNLFLLHIPNLLHESVPIGESHIDNVEIRFFSSECSILNFDDVLFNDFECNKEYIDFDVSAKISGSGFVILRNSLAQLHRALGNYMIDLHIMEHGYEEIYSPLLVNEASMFATGHFPKFIDDQFNISGTKLWLIPTSEVVLSNLVSSFKIDSTSFPLKFVSKTACFRKERGKYGYKVKGLIRQHQFDKVELVQVVKPERSYDALEELVFHAEKVLQNLNLSYRVISLCSKDIGFTSSKTYDLEVWFPKRKMYVEVSSCSNTEAFQSRRMSAKFKNDVGQWIFPHILNGSGLAIGRILLAIIENYSDKNGNLVVPDVLISYMNGKNLIEF